jgi:transposase InsO family protein
MLNSYGRPRSRLGHPDVVTLLAHLPLRQALGFVLHHGDLYLFEDLFSRKAVGWQVFDCENAQLASQLLQDICVRQGIKPDQLTLHSDNGAYWGRGAGSPNCCTGTRKITPIAGQKDTRRWRYESAVPQRQLP